MDPKGKNKTLENNYIVLKGNVHSIYLSTYPLVFVSCWSTLKIQNSPLSRHLLTKWCMHREKSKKSKKFASSCVINMTDTTIS